MANLNKIVKIKQEDYSTLISAGSVTINGVTYNYDANNLYVVQDPGVPEYAETAGYADYAGQAQFAERDNPLIIEVDGDDVDSTLSGHPYSQITTALSVNRRVLLKFNDVGDQYYLQLSQVQGDNYYEFCSISGDDMKRGTINDDDSFEFFTRAGATQDQKVKQTKTTSGNTSWQPLLLGYSSSNTTTFNPATVTNTAYATHLAKFKPSTGVLGIVGLNKMTTSGTVETGNTMTVWNTNGTTTTLGPYATSGPLFWANVSVSSTSNYITEPEVKSIKINGSTTNSASSDNCQLQYDTTNKCLNFVFA